jgi:serine/threonine-protein kinase
MSPEMALGKPADPRSDLYSLGCVAYWLLSGKMLFERETALSMVLAHTQTAPDRLSKRANQPIPLPLENLVLRCLEKDPARRPQSAKEVYDLLGACDARTEWTAEDAAQWWRSNPPSSRATYSE